MLRRQLGRDGGRRMGMALSPGHSVRLLVLLLLPVCDGLLAPLSNLSSFDLDEATSQSSTIYFNNPHLLKEQRLLDLLTNDMRPDQERSGVTLDTEAGLYFRDEAATIASHLRGLVNDVLGVTAMQAVFDTLPFVEATPKEDVAKEMASRMQSKFRKYVAVLQRNRKLVEELYEQHSDSSLCQLLLCCDFLPSPFSPLYRESVEKRIELLPAACDFMPLNPPPETIYGSRNASPTFEENAKNYPALKWQYFLSAEGVCLRHPARRIQRVESCRDPDDARLREVYLATVHPQAKFVVVLIDHGNSLSGHQLFLVKAIAKTILGSLSTQDYVGVLALSAGLSYPQEDGCLSFRMAHATLETKLYLGRFIDSLIKAKDAANHSLGFEKAFELARNTLTHLKESGSSLPESVLVVYVSRGLLSYLTEAKVIMRTIAESNERFGYRVVINTFAVIDDGRPLMYEKNVLQDVADQNYNKYLPGVPAKNVKKGTMIAVNTTRNLGAVIGDPFRSSNLSVSRDVYFSLPHWDSTDKGLVLSVSVPCFHDDRLLGVVGLDVHLTDVVEDVNAFGSSYAFLVHGDAGYVVVHPRFSQGSQATEQPIHTHIEHVENRRGFDAVWRKMRRLMVGRAVLDADVGNQTGGGVEYSWARVAGTPFVVCAVSERNGAVARVIKGNEVAVPTDVVYHRLDMLQEVKKCRHMRQLATSKAAALFLSPSCFFSPFDFLGQKETRRNVQSYMAYISDNTKLIANPGLKGNVRSDVAALVSIVAEWKRRFGDGSSIEQYIVRRYVATPHGVFQVFPGTMLAKGYEPTRRPWFTAALANPGRVVLTAPYLDVGGAGYIVTVSHTVYEGKSAAMHGPTDAVVAVMGVDFTLGYFYRLLLETIPMCSRERISCFLFDDMGYLVSHPSLIEPSGKGPLEQQHITHKEPLVANDILNHKGFVNKNLCNRFGDRTVQRFYRFNTSIDATLTNLVHGEHCSKYHIASIPGTNIFFGIVNQTCDMVTAFCPCSMVDRLCLNCHRMEQSECECPCECPLDLDVCSGELPGEQSRHPTCPSARAEVLLPPHLDASLLDALEPCVEMKCSLRQSESDCFGVLGCEWCQLETDWATPLARPFCADQRRCFGGVLGARTPYADEVVGLRPEEFVGMKNTPVGPVAGGIMACFLVLALAVYCYRHHVHRSGHQYVASLPDSQLHPSQLEDADDHVENAAAAAEEAAAVGGPSNMVLAAFENVSPYRLSSGYRRPPGGDSDHGYSTMTPHEDSEHAPYVEPLLLGGGRDKCRPPAGGSRTSSPDPFVTRLPNQRAVHVQVHVAEVH